jgi:RNA polymerase sigma-70 factor (ECF subfamily)
MVSEASEPGSRARTAAQFATTHWSVVAAAGDVSSPQATEALETLCRTYWPPIYAYLRRLGHSTQDAEDLTQGFFARLLDGTSLATLHQAKGRFRSWLLAVLKHFLAHEREKAGAQKRGGGVAHLPFDETVVETQIQSEAARALEPDRLFERQWALAVLALAADRLRARYAAGGRTELYEHLKGYVSGEPAGDSYAATAGRLGMTESAIRSAVHRLRRDYQQCIREEVAQTVATPVEIDAELRHLIAILAS